jgi:hypothetical protein
MIVTQPPAAGDPTMAMRDAARERLTHGLRSYAFAGWSAVIMVLFSWVVFGVVGTRGDGPVVGPALMVFVFFGGAGALMLRHFYRKRAFRRACVDEGAPIWGRVVGHGRAFNPFSSARKHTVTVELMGTSSSRQTLLSSTDEAIWHRAPPGTSLPGFLHPDGNRAFFPLEVGVG